jgi:hypothetical protein
MFTKPFPVRTATDPMHVVLTKRGQDWDEDIQPGRDAEEMNARLFSTDSTGEIKAKRYDAIWGKRRKPNGKPKPRYTEHGTVPGQGNRPVHMPVIMQENEFVRFQGLKPFFVLLMPEPELEQAIVANPFVDSDPNVPFSGFSAERDNTTGLYFVQKQVRQGDPVVAQLFWEMIFVVLDDGEPKLVDPDFFCDR